MCRKLNHILHKDILGILFFNSQITHVRNIQRTNHFRIRVFQIKDTSRTDSIRRDTEDRIIATGLKQHGVLRIRISGGDTCREPALLMR